ncbi:MAG: sugar ABC transporter permease [Propionibacteriaceae bacterium]|jgi:putative multiple sugar transport system permease protein|nr:sugar ABC transporter permease [Propionibacteriaceae bacterium]
MNRLKEFFGGSLRQSGMIFALVFLIAFFQIATGGKVLTPTNAMNIVNGNSYVFLMSMGMVLVIVIGQIDLSVGSVAAFVGICVALLMSDFGLPWWLAMLAGLGLGAAVGAFHGFFLAKLTIPGFITTLAGMMLFRGLQTWIGNSQSIPTPEAFWILGGSSANGSLPDWGPDFGLNNSTLLCGLVAIGFLWWSKLRTRAKRIALVGEAEAMWVTVAKNVIMTLVIGYATWLFASGHSDLPGRVHTALPIPGVIVIVLAIFYHTLSQRTAFGRHIYAVGGNRLAAPLTGINVPRTYFFTMMNMSILAAIAGMMFIGRSRASGPSDGTGWELDVIAAVFVGGAAVYGGIGTVMGSLVGGLVMAVLNNGIQLLGLGTEIGKIVKGMVLLLAVTFDVMNKVQGKPSFIGRLMDGLRPKKGDEAGSAEPPATEEPRDPEWPAYEPQDPTEAPA